MEYQSNCVLCHTRLGIGHDVDCVCELSSPLELMIALMSAMAVPVVVVVVCQMMMRMFFVDFPHCLAAFVVVFVGHNIRNNQNLLMDFQVLVIETVFLDDTMT